MPTADQQPTRALPTRKFSGNVSRFTVCLVAACYSIVATVTSPLRSPPTVPRLARWSEKMTLQTSLQMVFELVTGRPRASTSPCAHQL